MTYRDLEESLYRTFETNSDVESDCFNEEMSISASGWEINHPNGSIGITFWLMSDKIDIENLNQIAIDWAKKNDLIASTFYPNGIVSNKDRIKTQDWNNKSAQNADYIYGFTFYSEAFSIKKIYTKL